MDTPPFISLPRQSLCSMSRLVLVTCLFFAALVAAQTTWDFNLDGAARGTFTVQPASIAIPVGDNARWIWSSGGSIHAVAPENPEGPRCSSFPGRPNWWDSSPFWRGNNSVLFGLPRFTWTINVADAGNWPFQCPSNPPISSSFHCTSRDQRGNIVAYYPGFNQIYTVTVDPVAGTYTPSTISINQGDIIRWVWRPSPSTSVANIITEGTQFCSPYNTSTPANTTAKWAFPESPIFFNNGLWTPEWFVKFDKVGSFAYFSAQSADFSRCQAGFRGVITVNACVPDVNCQPTKTSYPTPVPVGADPVDPGRRVKGVDNWLLWTTVAYLTILGVLLIATVAACVIGKKKADGPVIAICLLPSEQPTWANVQI
jgi:plastocyanin